MVDATENPQAHFDDKVIVDPELEQLLEATRACKEEISPLNKERKELKEKIERKMGDFQPGSYRIGRFVAKITATPGGERSFETKPSRRITFKVDGPE